jgi:hypothetical protein
MKKWVAKIKCKIFDAVFCIKQLFEMNLINSSLFQRRTQQMSPDNYKPISVQITRAQVADPQDETSDHEAEDLFRSWGSLVVNRNEESPQVNML